MGIFTEINVLPTLPIEYESHDMGGQGNSKFCNLHYLFVDSCNLSAHLPPCCICANASILDHPLLAPDTQGNKLPTEYQCNIKHHGHILVEYLIQCKLRYQ